MQLHNSKSSDKQRFAEGPATDLRGNPASQPVQGLPGNRLLPMYIG